MVIGLLMTALALSACGDGAAAPPGVRPPQVTVNTNNDLRVFQGDDQRTVKGYEPFFWLPNGDLIVHTPSDSMGMAVYRPSTGKYVVESRHEWGRTRNNGEEYGLSGEVGYLTASDVVLRLVDRSTNPAGNALPLDYTVLATYDFTLHKLSERRLPDSKDQKKRVREYDTPVKVGNVILVPYFESAIDGEIDKYADTAPNGVVRIDGEAMTQIDGNAHLNQLYLSADAKSVLGLATKKRQLPSAEYSNGPGSRVVELDPVTGQVTKDWGFPKAYDNDAPWFVERMDKVGDMVAIQIATDCAYVDKPDRCPPRTTWTSKGGGNWTELTAQRGTMTYWQSPDTRVEWSEPTDRHQHEGPVTAVTKGKRSVLRKTGGGERVASGGLLPPVAATAP